MGLQTEQREQRAAMIAGWQQSGLTQRQYCLENNIAPATFQYWLKRSRPAVAGPAFIQIDAPAACVHAELIVPNGKRIVFHQPVTAGLLNELLS
jgi:hypothetical protein